MKYIDLKSFIPHEGYLELKAQENRSLSLAFLDGALIRNNSSASSGVMARSFKNGVWGLSSAPVIDEANLKSVIGKALANTDYLRSKTSFSNIKLPSNPASGEYLLFTKKPRYSMQDKINFLKEIDAYIAKKYPDLKSRSVNMAQLDMEKHIVVSDGSELRVMTPRAIMYALLTIDKDGEPIQHHVIFGGLGEFEDHFVDPRDFYEAIDKTYQQLKDKTEAVFAQGGTFECVLDSKLAGILSHEAIGHTTEADFVINGSIAGDYLNEQVASSIVTLIDVAHTWDNQICPVPVFIDDEGTLAEDCVVIENGVLKNYMHDKESAQRMGMALTGNARAYTFSDEPLIRMRNTMIVPGKDKIADMIASIDNGYYLIDPSNGQADSTSEFMFGVTFGYEIKHGKLGKAIKETTISGIAFDLLKTVTMISDEMLWLCAGMCGKKQMIPVGMGGPAIKCQVNIGGKS